MATNTVNYNPHIIESGTDNGWIYRKWSDGIAECWRVTNTTRSMAPWYNIYYASGADPYWNYPTGLFIEPPVCNINTEGSTGHFPLLYEGGSKTRTPGLSIGSGANFSNQSFTVYIHAIGKWK